MAHSFNPFYHWSPNVSCCFVYLEIFLVLLVITHNTVGLSSNNLSSEDRIRAKRAVTTQTIRSSPVPENVGNDVMLYDLASVASNRNYVVTGNSAQVQNMFVIVGNTRLQLNPQLSSSDRKKFDFESHPVFDVFVKAILNGDTDDVLMLTIELPLTDVNDEAPRFVMEPSPYLAQVQTTVQPGTVVYNLKAKDQDSGSDLLMTIVSVSPDAYSSRFQLQSEDSSVGLEMNIVTVGEADFPSGQTITITVTVEDRNKQEGEQITIGNVKVLVGVRPPQFYKQTFTGSIYESIQDAVVTAQDNAALVIEVVNFEPSTPLSLKLLESNSEESSRFELTDHHQIKNKQVIDYETTKSVTLTVQATQTASGLQSTAELQITVKDENDNKPQFSAANYANSVPENIPLNSAILEIYATDLDSGKNGELEFILPNNPDFFIETSHTSFNRYVGQLKVKRELDYDDVNRRLMRFQVLVKDKGIPSKSATAQIIISTQNVNDNPPAFVNSSNVLEMIETVKPGFVLTVVHASDIDGDQVKLSFPGNSGSYEIFHIEENTGLIQTTGPVSNTKDSYDLTIIAVDDGSCCGSVNRLTSTAHFTVQIGDVNSHKPNFTSCSNYDNIASVREKSPKGTLVIQVSATDPDRGENGRVIYSISSPGTSPFSIDPNTGNITVNEDDIVRTQDGYRQVTVIGENPIKTPLMQGWCTFRVKIEDINDHSPTFSQNEFQSKIPFTSTYPKMIRRMIATDKDIGENARMKYEINPDTTFHIDENTGTVRLIKSLDSSTTSYELFIKATDHGIYPGPLFGVTKLIVKVDMDNATSPRWTKPTDPNFTVNETAAVGHEITTLSCNSNFASDSSVEFILFNAEDSITISSSTFNLVKVDNNTSKVVTSANLDYNTKKEYSINVVCLNFNSKSLPAQISLKIDVEDQNNKFPTFVGLASDGRYAGSVAENSGADQVIIEVQADDKDFKLLFRTVTFRIGSRTENKDFFKVEPAGYNRAKIVTTIHADLDRERQDNYHVEIIAEDGAPSVINPNEPNSARRFVDVTVTDVNDCVPAFDTTLYKNRVPETASIGHSIFTVTAKDEDLVDQGLGLNYFFVEGNIDGAFSISAAGEIQVARKLDYDNPSNPKVYSLKLYATDQGALHTATTMVEITILDENDNRPQFSQSTYLVENVVTEGDESVNANNPLFLVKVQATDADIGRSETDIHFSILDSSLEQSLFTINPTSGEIFLIGVLDRDRIQPFYTFTLKAEDERINPLVSYADVKVYPMDINDNAPVFINEDISATVVEHSPKNTLVITVVARDKDAGDNGTVRYQLSQYQPSPGGADYFRIDSTGSLYTNIDSSQLDREKFAELFVSVTAHDLGMPPQKSSTNLTVVLKDINDQSPYFPYTEYNITISENINGVINRPIKAIDKDSDPANKELIYSIEGEDTTINHFTVSSDSNGQAFIGVRSTNRVDYEKDPHELTFSLKVNDGMPSHENSTIINIFVLDFNDNYPVFDETRQEVKLLDGTPAGTFVAQFNATDKDEGINAEIVYSILRESDPRYEFYIHPENGNVTTRKTLDREIEPVNEIIIIATDKGEIPLSSSATLIVTFTDVNDCAPEFKEHYLPKVQENQENSNTKVVEIFAIDRDTAPFGPPFGFKLPDGCNTLACKNFQLESNEAGGNNNGSAIIRTSSKFDREFRKEYYLPIIMWDMRGKSDSRSLTATNTLTIIIGDENDNKHSPGHQNIFTYSYKGTKGQKQIGRVYATDPDDWDLPDKTFSNLVPALMRNYFTVAKDTGMITMSEGIPPNHLQPFKTYDFKVDVYDKKFGNTETCTVSVRVDPLSDEAVYKSGSIRISGITAEQFILKKGTSKSKYDLFKQKLSSVLGYSDTSHIDIVSLIDGPHGLDVRFSAHGSPYLNPSQVESAVMLHQKQIESDIDIKIDLIPVNLCMDELYDVGCSMVLKVTDQANLVNANGTSYVGVKAFYEAVHGCLDCTFPNPDKCSGDYCYNGGSCLQDDWGKIMCQCLPGFDGPRCQQRHHHFDGSSVAFYKSLSVCAKGQTQFDFITTSVEDGLIMFSGPTSLSSSAFADVFILELKSGYPHLKINLGVGDLDLSLNGQDKSGIEKMPKLNDGKWHHIDIDKDGQHIQLTVDRCQAAAVSSDGFIEDWSPCRTSGTVPGPDILLNVPGFLQIGGHFLAGSNTPGGQSKGFSGCLKNLVHNTKLYDLSYKEIPAWNSGKANCPTEDRICGDGTVCGTKADCETQWLPTEKVVKCTCHPGWKGNKCGEATPVKDFGSKSFFKWQLSSQHISNAERNLIISLMFRTRQNSGTLFSMTNDKLNSILIKLKDGKLVLNFNLGKGDQTVILQNAHANSGQWHTLSVERYGNELSISMDNGEGRNYDYFIGQNDMTVLFQSSQIISSGARIPPVIQKDDNLSEDLVSTCISDVRFNGVWLPMDVKDNPSDSSSTKLNEARNVTEGCSRTDCIPDNCGPDKICVPLWEQEECRCPFGSRDFGTGKCEADCGSLVCYNKGKCVVVGNASACQCVGSWIGHYCNILAVEDSDDDGVLAAGQIAGVVISVLIFIIIVILIALFLCMRKRTEKDGVPFGLGPDDEFTRENVMYYDEEGAGENDNEGFTLADLQVPDSDVSHKPVYFPNVERDIRRAQAPQSAEPQNQQANVGRFIKDRLEDTDDLDIDSVRNYAYEGSDSMAESLSSLSTATDSDASVDYDYLNEWGPKFSRLADMYGAETEKKQTPHLV